jgi:hypothetical protein
LDSGHIEITSFIFIAHFNLLTMLAISIYSLTHYTKGIESFFRTPHASSVSSFIFFFTPHLESFQLSLTVLVHCRSVMTVRVGKWSSLIPSHYTWSLVLYSLMGQFVMGLPPYIDSFCVTVSFSPLSPTYGFRSPLLTISFLISFPLST